MWKLIERMFGMDQEKLARKQQRDHSLEVIAGALASMAHSFAIIAANTSGITPQQKAVIEKSTADLKGSHDRLIAAVQAAQSTANVKK